MRERGATKRAIVSLARACGTPAVPGGVSQLGRYRKPPQLSVALTILSGSFTGSPRLILSTFSIPDTTFPQAVYCLSKNRASSKQMKNCEFAESGLCARAIDTVPRTCGSLLNSAFTFGYFDPPVPVPCGQPVCAMKPSITRWN